MDVIIIGAGIAGPVTAMALRKAGIRAEVYEAYDSGADGVGAFLSLAPNGLAALDLIGIDPRDLGGFDTTALELRGATGRPLARIPMGRGDGPATQSVRRADLYAALRDEALRRDIPIHYGKRLTGVTTTPGGVEAAFADGTTAHGDLLLGADGVRSRVRSLLDPDSPDPRYTGLLNTGGYATGVDVDTPAGLFVMQFGRRAFFGHVRRAAGDVWWFANVPSRRALTDAETAERRPAEWRARLEGLFADDDGPAVDLIRATPDAVGPWNTLDLPRVPVWHRGPVGLIGDAAHAISPTSGQGASLAIEDGILVATALRDHGSPADALAAFERARRGRVERMIAQAKRTANTKIPNPLTRTLRDHVILPLVGRAAARATRDPATDYRITWDQRDDTAASRPAL
ncbi:FAD-dependent oxidoreductase [Myceligenerans pegani]|uniref:FAD-dependent monooxygenase n=1 Tax=Myceligenerans pegani TaxID=2776917 RepID=A0ABR9N547_9MICO|nr:FAD-dependent monooxygenase [Myceligenerans sp. TRM 65318]MBE1878107.1 FAD-dependent monooxygenase [Myceligenerans sp. TRM 65318]MBE3020378.1 FAD-dependent monooxygenase [Myceligenerans sp. TRM 65318]